MLFTTLKTSKSGPGNAMDTVMEFHTQLRPPSCLYNLWKHVPRNRRSKHDIQYVGS